MQKVVKDFLDSLWQDPRKKPIDGVIVITRRGGSHQQAVEIERTPFKEDGSKLPLVSWMYLNDILP